MRALLLNIVESDFVVEGVVHEAKRFAELVEGEPVDGVVSGVVADREGFTVRVQRLSPEAPDGGAPRVLLGV